MKRIRTFLLLVSIFTVVCLAQDAKSSAAVQPRADQPILASMVDRQISSIERKSWKLLKLCRKINSISLPKA